MAEHEKFRYRDLGELTAAAAVLGVDLPTIDDVSILQTPARLGRRELPNRLAVHPMEGCDASAEGAPEALTHRRYERWGAGGAGLIWFEATAVARAGRANPRQLWLHEATAAGFAEMVRRTRAAAAAVGARPVLVLQLTHSGRYSKPEGKPAAIIAHHSAVLDPPMGLPADHPLVTDDELDALQGAYVRAAELAAEAGFDAVDIKACHRYLVNELLASHTRDRSRYGGDYEGRTRFIREVAAKLVAAVGDSLEVVTRMNVYDGFVHPYGWGVRDTGVSPVEADSTGETPVSQEQEKDLTKFVRVEEDLSEPIRLIGELREMGLAAVNVTGGNPYRFSHVNRPADWQAATEKAPPEHPLEGVARLVGLARQVQAAHAGLTVIGTGYTWLRQYMPHFAAAEAAAGRVTVVGLGRGALAYPDFAAELQRTGKLDPQKVCVSCGSCTQIMRDAGRSGCVIRDSEVYGPIYRRGRSRAPDTLRRLSDRCRRCPDAPCAASCPAGVDIPTFLDAVAAGDERGAYQILRRSLLLAGACGAVCPSDVGCGGSCLRNILGETVVPVGQIHRDVTDHAIAAGWAGLDMPAERSGKRAAVVGAGPAGLAAAAALLEAGHDVAVFDRAAEAGGKLASVIPTKRLSRAALRREIDAVFGAVPADRLSWRLGEALGPERSLDDLLAEGFGAVCLAMGLGNTAGLAGGEGCEGVIEANAFLAHMNANPDHEIAGDVAVIGGGNTAADAATVAQARGAGEVYVLYRRGYQQMPAWPAERREILDAGVHLMVLTAASGYEADAAGRLCGVRVVRTKLGAPDASGRRRPVEVAGSEYVLPVTMAVEAIGESVEAATGAVLGGVEIDRGVVGADPATGATSRRGVWAAGDIVNGGTTVARALSEGREAGRAMAAFLEG